MHYRQALALSASLFALAACNPFHREPVTEVTRDANLNTRWRAVLVSPASLSGAVQMNGSASMQPGRNADNTDLSLTIANATPGGVHPWQVHRGQCGADNGLFGPITAYQALKIGGDGRGEAGASVALNTPLEGDYYVSVSASVANPEMIVACGNLAPPAR